QRNQERIKQNVRDCVLRIEKAEMEEEQPRIFPASF
ncbi:hypothetical protein pipiens_016636, partial [Culex pipiens pipiens]